MSIHRRSSRLVAGAFVSVVWACSGGGSGTVSSGNGGSNDSFIQQFCAYYQPCCQKHGLKTDGLQCRALAQLGASQGTYDPAAGSVCLSEMQALSTANRSPIRRKDVCASPPVAGSAPASI